MENKEEIWRDIPNYEGYYQVSNKGNVRSLNRTVQRQGVVPCFVKGKTLVFLNRLGYFDVSISFNGLVKRVSVHRLVAIAFLDNPLNKPFINHINGRRNDNRVKNLEWCTAKENSEHAVKIGLMKRKGEYHPLSKLNNELVLKIREMASEGISCHKIADTLKIPYNCNIGQVIKRTRWKHI
jgi:hypothetical protein